MGASRQVRPFGTWPSPLSAEDVARAGVRFGLCSAADGSIYWSELRPDAGPRSVIVRLAGSGDLTDINPAPYSARSRVHEYGGGEFALGSGRIVFVNDADQDLYVIDSGAPRRLTDAPEWRFADASLAPDSSRLVAVGERHADADGPEMPQNAVVAIDLEGPQVATPDLVLAGRDFYSNPRFSPDGRRLAWLAWDLPHMPWEAAELWIGDVGQNGGVERARQIAGGAPAGVFQPEWSPDGRLYFVADRDGWGNLHVFEDGAVRLVLERKAEFSRPLWNLGMTSYALLGPDRIAATCWADGRLEVGLVEAAAGDWTPLTTGLSRIDNIAACANRLVILGGDDVSTPGVHVFDRDGGRVAIPAGCARPLPEEGTSRPEFLRFPSDGGTAHGLFYPPASAKFAGPDGTAPPLIVSAHGGPTAMAKRGLDLERQYWTSRGFAFLDVDYRGSFGYGRACVEALNGRWGELDPADAEAAVRHVLDRGLADPDKVVIMGSSAGGLTVLNALAGSDLFAAGASLYGCADLRSLAVETHKFEAGYIDTLLGLPPGDEAAAARIFKARSPLEHADAIAAPMIFLQGLEDAVVPPSQSRTMAASLRGRGIAVVLIEYEGESHGFRKPATVVSALQSVHGFFARILRLEAAEDLPALRIDNMD